MTRVLILGIPDDYHADAIVWGLKRLGVQAEIWMASDLPDYCSVSVRYDDEGIRIVLRQKGEPATVRLDDVELIWNRRVVHPVAPAWAHAADRFYIENQCYEHMNGIRQLLGRRVRTINTPVAQSVAARKTVQLDEAARAGFARPATLISNDFSEIRAFWEKYSPVIVKPFKITAWTNENGTYSFHTSPMIEPTEELRAELEICPHIYQQRIDRAREVRVVAFGGQVWAMQVSGADGSELSVDVRLDMRYRRVTFEQVSLPAEIEARLWAYMAALGLDYGAFDFAIDTAGRWVFLECNEGGQFLFLETAIPEIHILDGFCRWFCELLSVEIPEDMLPLTIAQFEAEGGCAGSEISLEKHKAGVMAGRFLVRESEELAEQRS
jgi:hypothetical protein